MFVREKPINGCTYLYLVETVREDDPPPPKWSALRYGFEPEEDRDGEQEAPA